MKINSILSRCLIIIGCIATATIIMGMVKAPQTNPLAAEFTEIVARLPQTGANIAQLRNGLNTVHALLIANRAPQALNVLQDIKLGALKNMNFTTDFGKLTGEQLINIYFSDFIDKLEASLKSQPPAPITPPPAPSAAPQPPIPAGATFTTEQASPAELRQQFATIMEIFPQTGENIPAIRNILMNIQNMLQQPQPNLNNVLNELRKITSGPLKDLKTATELDSNVKTASQLISYFFDEFIRIVELQILMAQPLVAGRPHGLVNKENSCFMNSGIQALASLERLTNILLSHAFDDYYMPDTISALYIKLLNTVQTQRTAVIDPLPFCLMGWKFFPGEKGRQQDAPEFIQLLLQALAETDVNPTRNPEGINKEIVSLFQIKIVQRSYDPQGKPDLTHIQDHLVLPPIAIEPTNQTLASCLQNLFTLEAHPSKLNHQQITALASTSNYFLVRLRRTLWNRETNEAFKNEQPISFPLDNFNIASLSRSARMTFPLYRCKAFIVHVGAAKGGHYTAYIRMGNNWFLCDDTSVDPISLQEVQEFANKGAIDSVYGAKLTPVMFFYEQQ